MFDRIFANYLVNTGMLSINDLSSIFSTQEEKRARLGVIAVAEHLLSTEQVEEINQLQALYDKRFGDLAVEKGYLTDEQVNRLLFLQGNSFLTFVQSIIDLEILSMDQVNAAMDAYQKENNFTLSDMESLKSCDTDRIISIFLLQQPELLCSLSGIMVRTIARLIDYHVYIKQPKIVSEMPIHCCSMQELIGDHKILTALSGSSEAMKEAAIGFAGDEFIDNDEDSLDAMCEVINCVNGLFATQVGHDGIDVDMASPKFETKKGFIKSESILCLPLVVFGKEINLITILDNDYTLE